MLFFIGEAYQYVTTCGLDLDSPPRWSVAQRQLRTDGQAQHCGAKHRQVSDLSVCQVRRCFMEPRNEVSAALLLQSETGAPQVGDTLIATLRTMTTFPLDRRRTKARGLASCIWVSRLHFRTFASPSILLTRPNV